jgi:hypothetical protein
MRKLFLIGTALVLLAPLAARADGYASAQAQAGVGYATPQAALVPQYAPADTFVQREEVYTPPSTVLRERQVTEYVPRTYTIREEVPVAPTRTIIEREVAYAPARAFSTGCYGAGSALRSFDTGGCYGGAAALRSFNTGYSPLAVASATVGYGTVGAQRGLVAGRGLRARGLGGGQKTFSKSRAVTVTRRPGLVNRVLGR